MRRLKLPACILVLAAGVGATLAAASTNPPRWHRVDVQAKAQAERNVLAGLTRYRRHIKVLIDRRTGLLKDNVQVVCRGRGVRIGTRYERFVCTVRSRHGRTRFVLSYRGSEAGRFRIRLVATHRS
jgi:hypothetical protein